PPRKDGYWVTFTLSLPKGLTRCKNRAELGEGKLVFRWLYFRISGGFFARAQNDGINGVEWRGLNSDLCMIKRFLRSAK
ncbi:MAG TPA: hypothetical protein VK921_17600, partial [Anditalea sp.]|nr:hypothetical protein [Anditalea sp.]